MHLEGTDKQFNVIGEYQIVIIEEHDQFTSGIGKANVSSSCATRSVRFQVADVGPIDARDLVHQIPRKIGAILDDKVLDLRIGLVEDRGNCLPQHCDMRAMGARDNGHSWEFLSRCVGW
ncbi:hypothetical protein IX56_12625 [Paracoccus sanguinis]|uniref:Uncharacterized protein n=1 Tax=Paracoccus sanguinis TaxID=1545044 RepID=A0A099GE85_9RHOB|nr:hypothetical protein IX56_12625 [Paracoccus sanguinis]